MATKIIYKFNNKDIIERKTELQAEVKEEKIKFIIKDRKTDKIYYLIHKNNKLQVYLLDTDKGLLSYKESLELMIEEPKIYNNIMYYLDYNRFNESRVLYKIPLE